MLNWSLRPQGSRERLVKVDRARTWQPSICYVVPHSSADNSEHFAHLPGFLTEVAKLCRLFVIVERGQAPDIPGAQMVVVQTSGYGRLRRLAQLARLVWRLRSLGCDRFFVRISQGAGLLMVVLSPILRLRVFYWNSGQGKRGWPSWRTPVRRLRVSLADLRTKVRPCEPRLG